MAYPRPGVGCIVGVATAGCGYETLGDLFADADTVEPCLYEPDPDETDRSIANLAVSLNSMFLDLSQSASITKSADVVCAIVTHSSTAERRYSLVMLDRILSSVKISSSNAALMLLSVCLVEYFLHIQNDSGVPFSCFEAISNSVQLTVATSSDSNHTLFQLIDNLIGFCNAPKKSLSRSSLIILVDELVILLFGIMTDVPQVSDYEPDVITKQYKRKLPNKLSLPYKRYRQSAEEKDSMRTDTFRYGLEDTDNIFDDTRTLMSWYASDKKLDFDDCWAIDDEGVVILTETSNRLTYKQINELKYRIKEFNDGTAPYRDIC
jgi:hypothetical protein